jgi:RHS repeat-associated protein
VNGTTATFGISATSNRLMSVSGAASLTYGYDPQGNLQTVDGATAFQYNPSNRLASAGGANDYVSPEGQRLRKTSAAGTTYFAPEGASLLAEGVNGTRIDYVWLNGRLIGRASGGAVYAVHDDQTGRPQMVTDASGAVAWKANNYPFDRAVIVDSIGGLNVGFPGSTTMRGRGAWNNGYRDYSASLGRYIEGDPIGLMGGINAYVYVGGGR